MVQNPVAQAEYDHLQRDNVRNWFGIIGRGFFWVMASLAVLITAASMSRALTTPDTFYEYDNVIVQIVLLLAIYTFVYHFRTVFKTLGMASHTILREKESGTWETLLLTNMNSRRLVMGKCWAIVRLMWPAYARLTILRVGTSIGVGAVILASNRNFVFWFDNEPSTTPAFDIVLVIGIITVLTMSNLLLTAVTGVLASMLGRLHSPAIATGQVIRMGFMLLPAVLFMIPGAFIFIQYEPPLTIDEIGVTGQIVVWLVATLVDNGTLLTSLLANPLDAITSLAIPVSIIFIILYFTLIWLALKLAQFIAQRQGATG